MELDPTYVERASQKFTVFLGRIERMENFHSGLIRNYFKRLNSYRYWENGNTSLLSLRI